MEYNVKLINVYASLRHSDLLNGVVNMESMVYFQNTLNKSVPCTPTERLVFQTHRKLLKVSIQDSISIITNTKLWHLCLCAPIPVLRAVLNIPESIVIVYNKSTGYCVTSRLDTAEEFPVLNKQSTAPVQVSQTTISNDWINVAKKQPTGTEHQRKRREPRQSKQTRNLLQPVRILTRESNQVASLPSDQQAAQLTKQTEESLDDALKKLKEMPSQNWADMEDEDMA